MTAKPYIQRKDKFEWIDVTKNLPEPVYSAAHEPPEVSEDVLVVWPDGLYTVANYCHKNDVWTVVPELKAANAEPVFWSYIPNVEVNASSYFSRSR